MESVFITHSAVEFSHVFIWISSYSVTSDTPERLMKSHNGLIVKLVDVEVQK